MKCDTIADGVIAAVSEPERIPVPEGTQIIDARGKIVMPGGIDPHVHCKWHLPAPDGSATETEPPDIVSKAAVHGGTTTMIDFTRASQGRNVQDAIEKREKDWAGHCACDYAQHLMVEGALPVDLPAQVGEAIQAGFAAGANEHLIFGRFEQALGFFHESVEQALQEERLPLAAE
jgi:dihydropyrimidinase